MVYILVSVVGLWGRRADLLRCSVMRALSGLGQSVWAVWAGLICLDCLGSSVIFFSWTVAVTVSGAVVG